MRQIGAGRDSVIVEHVLRDLQVREFLQNQRDPHHHQNVKSIQEPRQCTNESSSKVVLPTLVIRFKFHGHRMLRTTPGHAGLQGRLGDRLRNFLYDMLVEDAGHDIFLIQRAFRHHVG